MKHAHKILWFLVVTSLIVALACVGLIGERLLAALLNYWKFSTAQRMQGIDLGANSTLAFNAICMIGLAISITLYFVSRKQTASAASTAAAIAGTLYFASSVVLFGLVSSGLAYLYCGR